MLVAEVVTLVLQFAESSGVPVGKVVNFLTNSHFKKKSNKQSDINKKRPFLPMPSFFATAIYISHALTIVAGIELLYDINPSKIAYNE